MVEKAAGVVVVAFGLVMLRGIPSNGLSLKKWLQWPRSWDNWPVLRWWVWLIGLGIIILGLLLLATGAGALLAAHSALVGRHLVTHEVRLERHHARDGEQERAIDGDHACRRHVRVPTLREELDEGASKLVGSSRTGGHPF